MVQRLSAATMSYFSITNNRARQEMDEEETQGKNRESVKVSHKIRSGDKRQKEQTIKTKRRLEKIKHSEGRCRCPGELPALL